MSRASRLPFADPATHEERSLRGTFASGNGRRREDAESAQKLNRDLAISIHLASIFTLEQRHQEE
jgi:hypothetical protein